MDARRILLFLLSVIFIISTISGLKNNRGRPNYIRRTRRIHLNEYLIPPPLPRIHPASRTARLATSRPSEAPGYFAQLMGWLNPFGFGSSSQPSPPPPPPHPDASYSSIPKFVQPSLPPPGPSSKIYNGPSPSLYDRPPLPPSSVSNQQYLPPVKAKNCSPCNKVPWVPMQHDDFSHSGDASFVPQPPPPPPLQLSPLNGGYLPSDEVHDAHYAASQEVKAPDYSFVPPLPIAMQDGNVPLVGPLPNPHLYPGPMPPLFKPENFHNPTQPAFSGEPDYLGVPPSFGNGALTANSSSQDIATPGFNNEHNGQSVYSNPSGHSVLGTIHEGLGYINSDTNNGEFENFDNRDRKVHNDLSPSGTQVSHGHANILSDKQRFDIAHHGSLDSINHQTSFGNTGPVKSFGISTNEEFYDVTGPNAPLDASFTKIENPVHFEQSPLLDLSHKGESRTDSSPISPTSNTFTDFGENIEITRSTSTPANELIGARQRVAPTDSYFSANRFQAIDFSRPPEESQINHNVTQDLNRSVYDVKTLRGQDISYIPPSGQSELLWSKILSTTSRSTERKSLLSTLKSYDGEGENVSNQNARYQSAKRNKQVQVIIPYTSQYTPLPFHPPHGRNPGHKFSHADESNHDNYASEESQNRIRIASLPNSSHIFQTTSTTLQDVTRKSSNTKMNNSIDVHRLQKNIDNWTIQEYSKGTTASTVSPSSVNPYLSPSKQIPGEYLTTTESIDHVDSPREDNVKTFTLAGFSFNDLDPEGSASNRVEGARVQIIRIENSKSAEGSTDSSTVSTKDDTTWQHFSVAISPVNKERVYVVTPQPITTTPKLNLVDYRKEKTSKEAERNSKDLRKAAEVDIRKTKIKSSTFESIEKAYQVLPQAVNNLAVASTGPESVPLWGIMEHEEFASLNDDEHNNENEESPEIPVLYAGHSKVSRARR